MTDTIVLPDTKPYFLLAKGDRKFSVVKEIEPNYDIKKKGWFWVYTENENFGILEENLDLIETPNIDFSVIVRSPTDSFSIPYIIQVLSNLAEKSNHDCFSFNCFGDYVSRFIRTEGDIDVREVKPRLFRLRALDDKI